MKKNTILQDIKMNHIYSIIRTCALICILLFFLSTCSENSSVQPDAIKDPVTISPQGGTYKFPGGITLIVPAGAVDQEKDIQLRQINHTELLPIFDQRGVSIDNFLACVEGTPDGLTFNQPIQLILSIDLEPGEVPIIHEVDLNRGNYSLAETEIICDPKQNTLQICSWVVSRRKIST